MKYWLLVLSGICLFAQTPEELAAQKAYRANINALLIFTSESGLSTGLYRFSRPGVRMQINSLPFVYHLEPYEKNLNLFISGGLAYSVTRLDTEVESSQLSQKLTLDNKLQTYTAGLGTGLRYKSAWGVDFLGGAELLYSRVSTSISSKDRIDQDVKELFGSEYNDNITYKLLLSAEYEKEIQGFRPYAKLGLRVYETKVGFDVGSLSSFVTQSDVTSLSLGAETPPLLKYNHNFLSLEGYIKANYLHGDITEVVGFHSFINLGAFAYWNTPKSPSWAKRFYLEVSTIRAEGLEGYNIGTGFSLAY
jgi:hypothetical protein